MGGDSDGRHQKIPAVQPSWQHYSLSLSSHKITDHLPNQDRQVSLDDAVESFQIQLTQKLVDNSMLRTAILNSNDAMRLLFKASLHIYELNGFIIEKFSCDSSASAHLSNSSKKFHGRPSNRHSTQRSQLSLPIETNPTITYANISSLPSKKVLKVWNTYHFVKIGWLSAQEAVAFVDS
jgi:hypothetical protein